MGLAKVYSFPRSGTHFLEAFLALNFYSKRDLSLKPITWGHWSNRQIKDEGNPYGKLFGHHLLAGQVEARCKNPMLYINRDPRAAALSIWKTESFINKDLRGISFSDFLRVDLDWCGSPSVRSQTGQNVIEHWVSHFQSWLDLKNSKLLILSYEELVNNPNAIYNKIAKKFFKYSYIKNGILPKEIQIVEKKTGLLPNNALINDWHNYFQESDYLFYAELKKKHPLLPE